MRAAVSSRDAVQVKDVPKPSSKDTEVLVRVHATTICAADYRVRAMPLIANGKILGMELSGTVVSVGKAVTRFHRPRPERLRA